MEKGENSQLCNSDDKKVKNVKTENKEKILMHCKLATQRDKMGEKLCVVQLSRNIPYC